MEEYWSRFQKVYNENQEIVVGKELLRIVEKNISKLPSLGNVLELGCGPGRFSRTLSSKAVSLLATDYSEELLVEAEKNLKNMANVSTGFENCMNLSQGDNSFDSVFMANVLHVIEDPKKAIDEIYRVLKPGGLLVITSFTTFGMSTWKSIKMAFRFLKTWGKPPKNTHRFSPEDVSKIASESGFIIESCKLIGDETKSIFLTGRKKY